ncbi:MAG TPA: ABC transporter permease [Nevskiaceae bacterium]|nr:ABC transporter permease [Nevskiaceae bacterium]
MIPAIKAEFRKLFTVRSTYITALLAFGLMVFFAFYVEGYKAAATVNDPHKLMGEVTSAVGVVSILATITVLLLMAHEYRYNTIMYTLTASNSRTKILLAKIIAASTFAIGFTLLAGVLSPLLAYLGIQAKGLTLVPQEFYYWDLLWRCLFYGWGFAMFGLLLATLARNQVAAIAALFVLPSTIEPLLGLLLKKNAIYLPIGSLSSVMEHNQISYVRAALVFSGYLVVGWIVAWLLFIRRDAN